MATGQGLIASAIQRNNQSALEADRGMREGFALYDRRRSNRVQEALAREGQSIQREGLDLQREGINVNREQLSNQRRGQDIQMALGEKGLVAEGRRTAVAEGQLALQREQQDIENRMQYKETGDKYGKVFVNMFDDMTSQQKELLAKSQYIVNTKSYLRLRDLEEINIISSFIYEIEKNSLLISQQSLNTNRAFALHKERFYALLNVLSKFVIILESPEMLNSLTPPISTHEKYAFGHSINSHNTSIEDLESKDNDSILGIQRQGSKHVHFSSSVYGGNNSNYYRESEATLSIHDEDSEEDHSHKKQFQAHASPLPLGKLLHETVKTKTNSKSGSVESNIGDEEYDVQLRRDQFLQRIEYYILDILVSILFCCRYEILDNWNHRNAATYLFEADLRQLHFLSNRGNKGRPSLSVLMYM